MFTNSSLDIECPHLNILSDNSEGGSVCLECGQVLECIYTCNQKYISEQTEKEKNLENEEEDKILKQRQSEIELIKTLQDKWFFPYCVIEETSQLFLKLIEKDTNIKCYRKTLFAFAFYKTLLNYKCSHSISEICFLFDLTSIKIFTQIAEKCGIKLEHNIEDFLNRFCSNLEFDFKQRKKVFMTLKTININLPPNIRPETICGIILLDFHYKNPTKWSTKEISEKCEISYQTLIKNYALFKNIFIDN